MASSLTQSVANKVTVYMDFKGLGYVGVQDDAFVFGGQEVTA
jgi:hypothetical protein